MSKLCTLFIAALLFNFILSSAARPQPDFPLTQHEGVEEKVDIEEEKVDIGENCEGVGKEECLMRRTLVAQVDYIYSQKHKP